MSRHLLAIDDLDNAAIDCILARARELDHDRTLAGDSPIRPALLGLLFIQPSLRTRVGFTAAAARLGWQTASVLDQREGAPSVSESLADTARVLSGFSTIVVARPNQPISSVVPSMTVPLINGGDTGPGAEHPTQALIDVFAMEEELGPVSGLRVAICGDLRMRAVRSLMRLLVRRRPLALSAISVPELTDGMEVDRDGHERTRLRQLDDLSDVDVLYVAGVPHKAIPEPVRDTLRVTPAALSTLPRTSIVLSPLPVIDEIDPGARQDPRVRMFEQSDRSVAVRMAVLEHMAGRSIQSNATELKLR